MHGCKYKILVRKCEGKRPFQRNARTWENNIRDRKREYNVTFEARSGISFVKLMNWLALASFLWKPQCPLVSE
jgi:hypothetical protein